MSCTSSHTSLECEGSAAAKSTRGSQHCSVIDAFRLVYIWSFALENAWNSELLKKLRGSDFD